MTLVAPDELVLVPQRGFRLAHSLASTNVVLEQDGKTLTAGAFSDRDGTEVAFTVVGRGITLDSGKAREVIAQVRATDDRGHVLAERPSRWHGASSVYPLQDGTAMLRRVISFERLDPDTRAIDLEVSGYPGEWRVRIPMSPVEATGARGTVIDVTDVHQGIAVSAQVVARSETLTAIELVASFVEESSTTRLIEGIGSNGRARALGSDLLVAEDDTGTHHLEKLRPIEDPIGQGRRREVATFEAMPPAAARLTFDIPHVTVHEWGDETVLVPVPGDTAITMGGCRATVTTSRIERSRSCTDDRPSPVEGLNGASIRVEMRPTELDADRALLYAGVMESNTRGMNVTHLPSRAPIIEVPDPTGDSRYVTLRGAHVRVRGPWHLEIPLPAATRSA